MVKELLWHLAILAVICMTYLSTTTETAAPSTSLVGQNVNDAGKTNGCSSNRSLSQFATALYELVKNFLLNKPNMKQQLEKLKKLQETSDESIKVMRTTITGILNNLWPGKYILVDINDCLTPEPVTNQTPEKITESVALGKIGDELSIQKSVLESIKTALLMHEGKDNYDGVFEKVTAQVDTLNTINEKLKALKTALPNDNPDGTEVNNIDLAITRISDQEHRISNLESELKTINDKIDTLKNTLLPIENLDGTEADYINQAINRINDQNTAISNLEGQVHSLEKELAKKSESAQNEQNELAKQIQADKQKAEEELQQLIKAIGTADELNVENALAAIGSLKAAKEKGDVLRSSLVDFKKNPTKTEDHASSDEDQDELIKWVKGLIKESQAKTGQAAGKDSSRRRGTISDIIFGLGRSRR